VHVHAAFLDADEIEEVDGLAVTTVARTVGDLARSLPFEPALVVADAALHNHLVTPLQLQQAVERMAGRAGCPAARRVVAAADARAASPGETRTRIAIARAGLPKPTLQHVVAAVGAEVDFYWEEFRTVGEFDGAVKYGRALRSGRATWCSSRSGVRTLCAGRSCRSCGGCGTSCRRSTPSPPACSAHSNVACGADGAGHPVCSARLPGPCGDAQRATKQDRRSHVVDLRAVWGRRARHGARIA
jgi:hypothetical protein